MNSNTYNQMTIEEKANYFFQKFRTDFDNWDCETNNRTDENCAENRLTLLKLKYLPKEENEKLRDLYSILCDEYLV